MTNDLSKKIEVLNLTINQYFRRCPDSSCKPKDLMSLLIQNNLFSKDHREGLPLRRLLRYIDDNMDIYKLIPSIRIEKKNTNRYWYFDKINA